MGHTDAVGLADSSTNGSTNLKPSSITRAATCMNYSEDHESAAQRVLETNELLENILSYLPAKKVFVVQRVSKRWNNIIATSPSIQRKPFIRPANKERETWMLLKTGHRGTPEFRRITASLIPFLRDEDSHGYTPVFFNPLVPIKIDKYRETTRMCLDIQITAAALKNRHISLWQTLVCDPPVHRAEVLISMAFGSELSADKVVYYPFRMVFIILSNKGLTVGEVVKALMERSEESWKVPHMISEIKRVPRPGWDIEKLFMEVEVKPDRTYSHRPFRRGGEYITSEEKRASADAIYAAKGEPVEMLRSDLADVWQPLVAALHDQRHK